MGCRAAERTRNMSNALGPGAAGAGLGQEGVGGLAKEVRVLARSAVAGRRKRTTAD